MGGVSGWCNCVGTSVWHRCVGMVCAVAVWHRCVGMTKSHHPLCGTASSAVWHCFYCKGDSKGCIKVWNLAASACSCELVPEVDVAVRCVGVPVPVFHV